MNPRLRRLQADYEDIRRTFSGHPAVRIEPDGERLPPEVYQVNFRLNGLVLKGKRPKNLEFEEVEVEESTHHRVEIRLPRLYPAEKPYVVAKTPVFHPNIQDYYCLVDDEYWSPSTRLVDLIAKIGNMIQYRLYNLASPLDPLAANWARVQEKQGKFPVGDLDLGAGEPDSALVVARGKSSTDRAPNDLREEAQPQTETSASVQPQPVEKDPVAKLRHE